MHANRTMVSAEQACQQLNRSEEELKFLLHDQSEAYGTCLLWRGQVDRHGYGRVVTWTLGERRRMAAHRLSYLLSNGPIPSGLCVLHICDKPACIHPDHLVAGTPRANMHDMVRKGRSRRGAASPRARLNATDAENIRILARRGALHRDIADQFGVSRSTITKIINGTAYSQEAP